ncbi:hypothetical protein [Chryseobacterium indoltheticum]
MIVEAMQYFSRLGVFDVDDVLLNTFGVFWVGKLKESWRLDSVNL